MVHQERYAHDPSAGNLGWLMSTHVLSGDAETAFPLAQELWSKLGSNPSELGSSAIDMAWAATKTEHPLEARLYRDAAAENVRHIIEAGMTTNNRYIRESQLAALDGREKDAVDAISKGLDRGLRWQYGLQTPIFDNLKNNPAFQAQVSRQRDLIDADRKEILAMLCGPDTILTTWEPAPETCL